MIHTFEDFEVDTSTYELRKSGKVQNVEKQVFDLLLLLVSNPDRLISKDEIIETVWGGRAISDAAINSRISTLRSVLDDSGREQRLIKTIHNQGLRFAGEVNTMTPTPDTKPTTEEKFETYKKQKPILPILGGMVLGAALLGAAFFVTPNVGIIDTDSYSPWQQSLPTESYWARDAYLRGVKLRDKSNSLALDLAAAQFQIAIDNDAEFAPAYAALASVNAYIYENEPHANLLLKDKISQSLAQAKALSPKSKEVRQADGEIAALRNDYAQAMMLADNLIADDKHFLPAYLLRSKALYHMGRIPESIDTLGIAISMDPLSPQILQAMSEAKLANGDYDGSLEAAQANVWWNPESSKAHITMARIERNNAQYESAFDYLERARALNPLDSAVIYELIDLFNDLGMPLERSKAAYSNVQEALVQALEGNKNNAKALLGRLELEDTHIDIHYLFRDFETASRRFNIFLSGRSEMAIQPGQGLHYARMCHVFRRSRSPMETRICNELAQYYSGKEPDNFLLYEDVLGGVAYFLSQEEDEKALLWLNSLVQKGHALMNLVSEPVFLKFETVEGYAEVDKRMTANAQLHKSHIRSKLEP